MANLKLDDISSDLEKIIAAAAKFAQKHSSKRLTTEILLRQLCFAAKRGTNPDVESFSAALMYLGTSENQIIANVNRALARNAPRLAQFGAAHEVDFSLDCARTYAQRRGAKYIDGCDILLGITMIQGNRGSRIFEHMGITREEILSAIELAENHETEFGDRVPQPASQKLEIPIARGIRGPFGERHPGSPFLSMTESRIRDPKPMQRFEPPVFR